MMPPERSIDQGVASGASVGEQVQEKGRAQRACLTFLLSGAHLPGCKNTTHKYARLRVCAPGCPTAEKARDCPAARGGRGVTASCVSSDAPQSSENEQPGRPKRSRYGAQHSASVGGGHVEGGGGDGSGGGGQSQRVHSHEGSGGVENADADAAVAAAAAIVAIRTTD